MHAQLANAESTPSSGIQADRARRMRPPRGAALRRSRSTRPTAAAPPARSSSTTCSCWPAACCATRTRSRRAASLHERYQRLLLDEFQDTDPIQIELAVRIAADDPPTPTTDVGGRRRRPGRLFVVGDPKQSIYRFRRADISTFLAAATASARRRRSRGLTTNFRTVAPVIDWVNDVFATLMDRAPRHRRPLPSQPAYVGLDAAARRPTDGRARRWPWSAHRAPQRAGADVCASRGRRRRRAITGPLAEGWSVGDGDDGRGGRAGSATSPILVPARTSLPFLEDALDGAGIPYRAESSSLVYATRAVRDLLMVARAVDDPTDHLRIVAALRTPAARLRRRRPVPPQGRARRPLERTTRRSARRGPGRRPRARPACAYLREIHGAPLAVAVRAARPHRPRPRVLELGFAEGRPRDVWRRLRFVIDQARAWSDATGGSLRGYLHWVEQQTVAEGRGSAESVPPETDDDAVRIMTIHAAKGLEFPITIVCGL